MNLEPLNLKSAFRRDFAALDLDGDGRLTRTEVEECLLQDQFTGDSAALVGTLYRHRRELGRQGIAPGQVTRLGGKAEESFQEKLKQVDKLKPELFPERLEETGNANQGHVSDCWLITGMQGMRDQRLEELAQRIQSHGEGSYQVAFPDGSVEEVARPTQSERLAFAQDTEGYLWASVLEKAAGQKSQGFLKERLPQNALEVWGTASRAIKVLTGNSSDTDHTLITSKERLREKIASTLASDGLVIGSSKNNLGRRLLGRSPDRDDIIAGHCYAITGFDPETDTLTLRNPWGDTPWKGAASDSKDGSFPMPLEKFSTYFSKITYEKRWVQKIVTGC